MTNTRILIAITGIFMLSPTQVYGSVITYPFRQRAQRAELIVEGVVEQQTELVDYDRRDLTSFRNKSIFKVSRVYKGSVTPGEKITAFSHMNFLCDTSNKLAEGRRYFLMLKRHGAGFADADHGRGMWEIITLKPDREFVVGDWGAGTWGQPYRQFQDNITWALSEQPSWPEKPTISAEQAKRIASGALSAANIDLEGFELDKEKLLSIGSDIMGVAYKDEPMWLFHWVKPEAKGQSPLPAGRFAFCYVHAHTGKFCPKSPRQIPPARDVCSLFLKTHRAYRPKYAEHADSITISQIAEEQFRDFLPRLVNTFLKARPGYPQNTTFLSVEFPGSVAVNPLIFVLDETGHVAFAGIIKTKL